MIYTIGHSVLSESDFVKLMGEVPLLMDVRSHPGSRAHPQFNKGNMEEWLPRLGKQYIWEPGLGGWDARHMAVAREYLPFHVDVAGYSKGQFPKQIIGGNRLDSTTIRKQIEAGCSCVIPRCIAEQIALGETGPDLDVYLQKLIKQMKDDIKELKKPKAKRRSSLQLPLFDSPCRDVTKACPNCQQPVVAPQWISKGLWDYSFFTTLEEFRIAADKLVGLGQKTDVAICCCEGQWYKCHRSMVSDYLHFCGVEVRHLPGKKPHAATIGNRLERYHPHVLETWAKWRG